MSDEIDFSNFNDQEFLSIAESLCHVFNTTQSELKTCYGEIISDFDKDGWPPHYVSRDFFSSQDPAFHTIYTQSPSIAVDLPSLFELADGIKSKPTVVIIGQDSKSDQDSGSIHLGTPYGLHHKGSRENLPRTKLYFKMIYSLLELGYRVYLTDIYKIWVCNPNRPYYGINLPQADREKLLDILRSELSAINPTTIITWGGDSARGVSKIGLDIQHLKFPHPSGAANGTWQRLMNQSASNENKLAYFRAKASQSLSEVI